MARTSIATTDVLTWEAAIDSLRPDPLWAASERLLEGSELKHGISFSRLFEVLNTAWIQVIGNGSRTPQFEDLQRYYSHPAWLINAAYIESDPLAIADRSAAVRLVQHVAPRRVLDFGGGLGTVSRLCARHFPSEVEIDLLDVSAFQTTARSRLAEFRNIRVVEEPVPPYDAVICTEVLEHVLDPLGVVKTINSLLRPGGAFAASWSFAPGLDCHLPQNFHLNQAMLWIVRALGFGFYGFERRGSTVYSFVKTNNITSRHSAAASLLELLARIHFPLNRLLCALRGI